MTMGKKKGVEAALQALRDRIIRAIARAHADGFEQALQMMTTPETLDPEFWGQFLLTAEKLGAVSSRRARPTEAVRSRTRSRRSTRGAPGSRSR